MRVIAYDFLDYRFDPCFNGEYVWQTRRFVDNLSRITLWTNKDRSDMTASNRQRGNMTRRDVLRSGAIGVGATMLGGSVVQAQEVTPQAPAVLKRRPPNILYIICDQLGLDAVAAHGSTTVKTPYIDRLVKRGTTFVESHSTSPVCSPARSSLMTGFMPEETGVVTNNIAIHPSRRTVGHILGDAGYDSYYCGKWHIPGGVPKASDGFRVLPSRVGQGQHDDAFISHTCDAVIRDRADRSTPYLLVASFLQPHDICYYGNHVGNRIPLDVPFGLEPNELPELPPNYKVRPKAPAQLDRIHCTWFNDEQWRYYLYLYDRMIRCSMPISADWSMRSSRPGSRTTRSSFLHPIMATAALVTVMFRSGIPTKRR